MARDGLPDPRLVLWAAASGVLQRHEVQLLRPPLQLHRLQREVVPETWRSCSKMDLKRVKVLEKAVKIIENPRFSMGFAS